MGRIVRIKNSMILIEMTNKEWKEKGNEKRKKIKWKRTNKTLKHSQEEFCHPIFFKKLCRHKNDQTQENSDHFKDNTLEWGILLPTEV